MQTVVIYRDDANGFMNKYDTINSRAARLGMEPMTIRKVEDFQDHDQMGNKVWFRQYTIDGIVPKLNGWSLLTKIEHTANGNMVKTYGGDTDDVYLTIEPNCEHCGYKRDRNVTFIVRHDDGTQKQVGSTCVEDYTRSSFLYYASRADELMGFCEDSFKSVRTSPVRWVLAQTAAVIEDIGFAKSADAYPTWVVVKDMYNAKPENGDYKVEIQDKHLALADEVLAWAREGGSGDYRHNLKIAVTNDYMNDRHYALVVSAVPSYQRMIAAATAKPTPTVTEWFGNVKDKITQTVTVARINSFNTAYGLMEIITMTSGNNLFVWKTTSCPDWVEQGKTVTIKGTIKAHDTYRDTKQTVLTRVKTV